MSELRETILNIGADHEDHALTVDRQDDDEDGPGFWLLVCQTCDESGPLLDFAALARPEPDGLEEDAVLGAVSEAIEALPKHNMAPHGRSRTGEVVLMGDVRLAILGVRRLKAEGSGPQPT